MPVTGRRFLNDTRSQPVTDTTTQDAFEALANYVIADHSLDSTLQLVVDLAAASIPGAQMAGISLLRKGHVLTAVSTGAQVEVIDVLQYETNSGPCLQAIADGVPQLVRSMLNETRWPDFTNQALYQGVQSILAFPLKSSLEVFGALNIYSHQDDAFNDRAVSLGEVFGSRASVVLLNASRYEEANRLADQLQEALQSRAVIDQAKGILMGREGISADEAFDRLKALSQRSNLKVRELARRLVEDATGGVSLI